MSIACGSKSNVPSQLFPFVKTPGKYNSADVMTKQLTMLMIQRHIESLFLEYKDCRSDKAAKLRSVTRIVRRESTAATLQSADESFASV